MCTLQLGLVDALSDQVPGSLKVKRDSCHGPRSWFPAHSEVGNPGFGDEEFAPLGECVLCCSRGGKDLREWSKCLVPLGLLVASFLVCRVRHSLNIY